MLRVEAGYRAGSVQRRSVREQTGGDGGTRALVAAAPEPSGADRRASNKRMDGRPLAGFVTQLIASTDPSLRPSRAERALGAASLYADVERLKA